VKIVKVALAGNPNCGKTTLFNHLTGANHYVGNWPGVTVEKREGFWKNGKQQIDCVDLPGTYSLNPYSDDERVARDYILSGDADFVINVVDATQLERSLYLTLQLMETGIPFMIVVNMMDEAKKLGYTVSTEALSLFFNVPVYPISALKRTGIEAMLKGIMDYKVKEYHSHSIEYPESIEGRINTLMSHDVKAQTRIDQRYLALQKIEHNTLNDESYSAIIETIARSRYDVAHHLVSQVIHRSNVDEKLSNRLDGLFLNPVLAIPIFLMIMYGVFYLTFSVGGIFLEAIDGFFSGPLSDGVRFVLQTLGTAPWLEALMVDGIIGGVGGVLTFVPNIAIMFIAISFLEDSGYMARVAFIMDKWMTRVGLNGKTFIPMILGFGCNVPAIMATRTLDNEKDRLIAILINPFMSCGARFPVYVLFAGAFFPGYETMVTMSLYMLGVIIALAAAFLLRHTLFKGEETHFIMEMPSYRLPDLKSLAIHVWERVKGYLVKAGTVIFAASVILWVVLNFNFSGMSAIDNSFGYYVGKVIAPIFGPLGFGTWQASLSLLTGIFAKEIIVANMAILYGVGSDPSILAFGEAMKSSFTHLSAYAFLVFVLLYTPCVGVIGVVKRETNSWKWTFFSIGFQFAIAWLVSFVVYQVGSLFF
jgi:ferrous iron transport protein B